MSTFRGTGTPNVGIAVPLKLKDLGDVLDSISPTDGQVLTYDTTNQWQAETLASGVTDHTALSNIGTNTHSQIDTHIANTSNPHSVDASDVSLGNVDNTSDLSKPISTLTQTALDGKASNSHTHGTSDVTSGTFTDARISESSVTQHRDALLELGVNTQTGTSYTLVLGDSGDIVEMNNSSANTLTVPPNSSVAFPTGTTINVTQLGAGATTVVEGSGVTIRTPETLILNKQYAVASLYKRGTNEWVLSGYLQAV